jgi:hypothetical protein
MPELSPGPWTFSLVPTPDGFGKGELVGYVVHSGPVAVAEMFPRPQWSVAVNESNARLIAVAPDMRRIVRILESFRASGADSVSLSALMHDGDDTLGEAVAAVACKLGDVL